MTWVSLRSTLLCSTSLTVVALLFTGCAGQLTDAEKELLLRDIEGGVNTGGAGGTTPAGGAGGVGTGGATGGVGGTGGATGGVGGATGGVGGAAGAGGVGGNLDPCIAPIVRDKCSTVGCHGGTIVVAGLNLSAAVIAAPGPLIDKVNAGDPGPLSCMAGFGKIIDSQRPDQSLLYTKTTGMPCGSRMPPGTPLTATESACFLSWIRSVLGLPGGAAGASGAGGAGGASGAGGVGGAAGARDGGRG